MGSPKKVLVISPCVLNWMNLVELLQDSTIPSEALSTLRERLETTG